MIQSVPDSMHVPKPVSVRRSVRCSKSRKHAAEECEVECIKRSRMYNGKKQYLVKWLGYSNKHNEWLYLHDLFCDDLIDKFESQTVLAGIEIRRKSLQSEEEVSRQSAILFGPDDCYARLAVCRLMHRQGLAGTVDDWLPGYKSEICNVLRRRLILQDVSTVDNIKRTKHIVALRMILELKRSGRMKARLICQGFREPIEWDRGSNMSPVAFVDTIRMMILMNGPATDVISTNDISVAFLQAHGFDADDKRYVSYKAFKEANEYVFQLCGPLYGQRIAR